MSCLHQFKALQEMSNLLAKSLVSHFTGINHLVVGLFSAGRLSKNYMIYLVYSGYWMLISRQIVTRTQPSCLLSFPVQQNGFLSLFFSCHQSNFKLLLLFKKYRNLTRKLRKGKKRKLIEGCKDIFQTVLITRTILFFLRVPEGRHCTRLEQRPT